MKHFNRYLLLYCFLGLLCLTCACKDQVKLGNINIKSNIIAVKKVENLTDEFILGMDASCVPSLEKSGVKYYDHNGVNKDVYEILSDNGINYIRIRIWVNPYNDKGFGYGGGNCDINNAIEIGKRATDFGMKVLINFHYSDFWADPVKQKEPKAWKNFSINEKENALYNYTKESLEKLKNAGVNIGMVQIGNETNGAMCGEFAFEQGGWERITKLMSAGAKAVREVCPSALIAMHFTNPEKIDAFREYGEKLDFYNVDYDVFASSYYPFWHGTLENLAQLLSEIAIKYDKKVMVAETSYAYTNEDTDFYANTLGSVESAAKEYPFTIQGQVDFIRDLVDTVVNKTKCGIGVFYWEGTWISVGGKNYEENMKIWEKYGSGWASSFSAEYDPDDAGKWYGGCAVDNQAFFDKNGNASEALKIFALLKNGNEL